MYLCNMEKTTRLLKLLLPLNLVIGIMLLIASCLFSHENDRLFQIFFIENFGRAVLALIFGQLGLTGFCIYMLPWKALKETTIAKEQAA